MNTSESRRSRLRTLAPVLLLGACAVGAGPGCSSGQPILTVTSLDRKQTFQQNFTRAYVGKSEDGDTNIVLLDEPAPAPSVSRVSGKHGQDRNGVSLRQVMHICVLWSPERTMKADAPSATNAAIHWYVYSDPRSRSGDMLEYCGTGFVRLDEEDGKTQIVINNATLNLIACRGALTDPIGRSTFEGAITAREDNATVKSLLGEVKTTVAAAGAAARPAPVATRPPAFGAASVASSKEPITP